MAITNIDIPDELMAEAQRLLGTTTKKDTVIRALEEVARRIGRRRALDSEVRDYEAGLYDDAIRAYEARKAAHHGEGRDVA